MDKVFNKKTISKESIYASIKYNVSRAIKYDKYGDRYKALSFAKLALFEFKILCYLGIGFDDDFSSCYDYYAERTDILKIVSLTNEISNMLKYDGKFI